MSSEVQMHWADEGKMSSHPVFLKIHLRKVSRRVAESKEGLQSSSEISLKKKKKAINPTN